MSKSAPDFYASIFNLTVLVAGLGYFVDTFDFFLYNSMRVVSLTEMGLSGDALTQMGIVILNCTIAGTLIGSLFWGILGDKIGRKKGLLGSILIYSIGMFANAFIRDPISYAALRFFIGFGLAGELGLGATLVAETIQTSRRTFALALFTVLGVLGVTFAGLSIEFVSWRISCMIGGGLGLILLLLRSVLYESKIYKDTAQTYAKRGSIKELWGKFHNLKTFVFCVLVLVPNYFVTGIMLTLSPEIAKAIEVNGVIKGNISLAIYFAVAAIGDLLGATLSGRFKSRKLVAGLFIIGNIGLPMVLLQFHHLETWQFYAFAAAYGLFNLWAISGTILVEQFPTHLRATATTAGLNFARGGIILMNLSFLGLKIIGVTHAVLVIGGVVICLGLASVLSLPESYNRALSTP